jgi:hypothetical protein
MVLAGPQPNSSISSIEALLFVGSYCLWLISILRACDKRLFGSPMRMGTLIEIFLSFFVFCLPVSIIIATRSLGASPDGSVEGWQSSLHSEGVGAVYVADFALYLVLLYVQWFCASRLATVIWGQARLLHTAKIFAGIHVFSVGVCFLQPIIRNKLGGEPR